MAYYISKPSCINPDIVVYYAGNNRWTDDASQKVILPTQKDASDLIANLDGKNGGWTGSNIILE